MLNTNICREDRNGMKYLFLQDENKVHWSTGLGKKLFKKYRFFVFITNRKTHGSSRFLMFLLKILLFNFHTYVVLLKKK